MSWFIPESAAAPNKHSERLSLETATEPGEKDGGSGGAGPGGEGVPAGTPTSSGALRTPAMEAAVAEELMAADSRKKPYMDALRVYRAAVAAHMASHGVDEFTATRQWDGPLGDLKLKMVTLRAEWMVAEHDLAEAATNKWPALGLSGQHLKLLSWVQTGWWWFNFMVYELTLQLQLSHMKWGSEFKLPRAERPPQLRAKRAWEVVQVWDKLQRADAALARSRTRARTRAPIGPMPVWRRRIPGTYRRENVVPVPSAEGRERVAAGIQTSVRSLDDEKVTFLSQYFLERPDPGHRGAGAGAGDDV